LFKKVANLRRRFCVSSNLKKLPIKIPPDTMLSGAPLQTAGSFTTLEENIMSVTAVWFEIPSVNFERAVKFYESMFQITMGREDIGGAMAMFPSAEGEVSGAIVAPHADYAPSATGAAIYLNGGEDLAPLLVRAVSAGGKVLQPKTSLPPGMGHFAHFQDSEGNRIGLHSMG
jgi:uncharacterized protein